MLLTSLLLGGALAATPAATPRPVKAGGYPVLVNVDATRFRGQAVFDTVHLDPVRGASVAARLTWVEGVQPDLTRVDPAELVADTWYLEPTWELAGEWVYTKGEHPTLGPYIQATVPVRVSWARDPLYVRVLGHELAGGLGLVIAVSDEPADLDPILAQMDIRSPRVPASAWEVGHVELDGYSLDVPPGWRKATAREQSWLGGVPVNGTVTAAFVEPTHLRSVPVYSCSVTTGAATPPAVIDPEKSAVHAANFRAYARAGVVGGKVATTEGTTDLPRFLGTSVRRVSLTEEPGEVSFVSLGDRDGYRLRAPAKGSDGPLRVDVMYTAWEKSALNCAMVTEPGADDVVRAFEAATDSIRVTDGEAHPMELSLSERYHRWWPYSHPALQLYWLPIPLAAVALWLAMRD